jgi:hypothetical protein
VSIEFLLQLWNSFFWVTPDLTPLLLFKVSFGLFVMLENLISIFRRTHLYSADGVYPNSEYKRRIGLRRPGLFLLAGSHPSLIRFVLFIGALAGLSLACRWMEPLAAAIIFLVQISKRNRNPSSVYSGESVAKFLSFLLIFGPSESFPSWGSPVVIQLMKIQLSLIYVRSTYHKLRVGGWLRGEMAFNVMATSHASIAPRFVAHILSYKIMSYPAAWGVLLVQATAPFLLWFSETAEIAIVLCFLMHFGLQLFMSIGFFQAYMITCLILFLPEYWAKLLAAQLGLIYPS